MAVCAGCQSLVEDSARFCPQCGVPLVPVARRLGPGAALDIREVGRVVLGHELGEGGMGVVYRGWLYYDPAGPFAGTPEHPVAVKVLHPLLRGRERARRLFRREAEALRRLAHPNIVHFFAFADDGGQLALVMELVQGEALSSVIGRALQLRASSNAPCLPFLVAWHYFAQLLGALAAVHELGILHRDVKPANVLARADGVIKLTDFGIARIPTDDAQATGGIAPGTGAYMSPEAVRGEALDPRSDLYSAAVVLYEMLAGRSPFDTPERNELAIRTAQIDEAPPPITSLVPSAPPVLDLLMARALAKEPAHRYGSAIELGEAFQQALGLPPSSGWDAQKELARLAKTISGLDLEAVPGVPTTEPDAQERAQELREDLLAAFQHSEPKKQE
jgi:eukaryotic-like serine/threonine-protein kinase